MKIKPAQSDIDSGNAPVLRVENLNKKFCQTLRHSMYYGVIDSVRSMLGVPYATDRLRKNEFWALEDVCFDLHRGETLGIIGANGSGKSTLLRLITGIYPPDRGRITFKGRIGALIAVGAGFHPHMTGRENIYLNGTILGMARQEIDDQLDDIIAFADIGDFLEAPVSTYSSGMRVRLGFSIAIHSDLDILLIDEILAVGDVGFQLKCFDKIGSLRKQGVATLLVSHNLQHISMFCKNVLLLNHGRVEYCGDIETGLSIYKKHFEHIFGSSGEIEKITTGTADCKIVNIEFRPALHENKIRIKNSDDLEIIVTYEAFEDIRDVEVSMLLELNLPTPQYFQATNRTFKRSIDLKKGVGLLSMKIRQISLNNMGAYLYFSIARHNRSEIIVWWRRIPVIVAGNALSVGWTHFDVEFETGPAGR
jgi:lipopolysaccharide transport system ATP-binding protein